MQSNGQFKLDQFDGANKKLQQNVHDFNTSPKRTFSINTNKFSFKNNGTLFHLKHNLDVNKSVN